MPTGHSPGHNGVVESRVKPIRVVIVDDNPEFLDSARRLLEHQGVRVAGVASTNADGLRYVQELRPDVTLVDVNLGEESGFDLAEALQESDDGGRGPGDTDIYTRGAGPRRHDRDKPRDRFPRQVRPVGWCDHRSRWPPRRKPSEVDPPIVGHLKTTCLSTTYAVLCDCEFPCGAGAHCS